MKYPNIIKKIKNDPEYVHKDDLPQPYRDENSKIKAVILGCDPTISTLVNDINMKKRYLSYVFALNEADDSLVRDIAKIRCDRKIRYNYFGIIRSNMECIGLKMNEVYIQNICQSYMKKETGQYFSNCKVFDSKIDDSSRINRCEKEYERNAWIKTAREWIEPLTHELDQLGDNSIPVLLTSQYLLLALVKPESFSKIRTASDYYDKKIVIDPSDNVLNRTLIPFYRSPKYSLKTKQKEYAKYIKKLIGSTY